jgi:hypothetical protein
MELESKPFESQPSQTDLTVTSSVWKAISEERYYEQMESLPPMKVSGGFLIPEPHENRPCSLTGIQSNAHTGYAECDGSRFFETTRPLTQSEFQVAIKEIHKQAIHVLLKKNKREKTETTFER